MKSWKSHTEARVDGRPGYPVVEIIWEDAQASAVHGWEEKADTAVAPTTTVGYLVAKGRRSYTVASLINLNHVGHCITIPKGCVLEVRYLVVKESLDIPEREAHTGLCKGAASKSAPLPGHPESLGWP